MWRDPTQDDNSRPLRVMFVITSMHVGGAETLLFDLIRRLDRRRFEPELCCLKTHGELGQKLASQVPVHAGLLRHKFDLRVLPRLARLFRRSRIDAVVIVGAGDKMFWGRLAARLAGVPVVISAVHSTGWPDTITWLNRRLTRLTDAFVAVAQPHAQYLVEQVGLPRAKVCIIPNGVDTDRFRPQTVKGGLRRELRIPATAPLAGIVAQFRPEKNHEMFLRVAARVYHDVPQAHFLVIGDGARRGQLGALAAELGVSRCVHFLGQRSDVPELLNLLDVVLLTSRVEANPVSVLEALATGTPVVATGVGSVPETVQDQRVGFLVEPDDDAAMAGRVVELLKNPELARQFGAAGREHVAANWSLESMVSGYEELIERLWTRNTGRPRPPQPLETSPESEQSALATRP